jgi:hypothetical protein
MTNYVIKKQEYKNWEQDMRCVRPMWKQIFIMLTYANMDMKRIWQGYGARLCLRLMLNILKEMKVPTPICTPLGT